jgi:RNA polymerase sigma-70 factor, ECF subfamily
MKKIANNSDSFPSSFTLTIKDDLTRNPMQTPADPQEMSKLIVSAKEGNPAAISELYEQHRQGVYKYLYYRSGDTQIADDLTSEVFIRMIRALGEYRIQGISFKAWLFQIAHNLLFDHFRKVSRRNHVQLEENLMSEPGEPLNPRTRPVERKLNSVMLQSALDELPNDQRDVIVMRFVTGMSITEVAHTLHKSEDAVKGLQRRALASLRGVLTEWEKQYA